MDSLNEIMTGMRDAAKKINENFSELFAQLKMESNVKLKNRILSLIFDDVSVGKTLPFKKGGTGTNAIPAGLVKSDGGKLLPAVAGTDFEMPNASNNYSTAEVSTGCKWINGATIYKKTVSCGALPNAAGSKIIPHGIRNLSLVVCYDGISTSVNGVHMQPIPQVELDGTFNIMVRIGLTNIELLVNTDRSIFVENYVTLYYIKTS